MQVRAQVAAGTPREMEEIPESDRETVELPASFLRRQSGRWILRVTGGSMVEANIRDGDLVVVRRTHEARDRQIVVARIDGAPTIKRYRDTGGRRRLQAESADHPDIPLTGRTGDVEIIGVVERVITQPADSHLEAPARKKTRPRKP